MLVRNRKISRQFELPPKELERASRIDSRMEGQLLVGDDVHALEINNISTTGFGATSPAYVPIGANVIVDVPHLGKYRAQVRWALGAAFGARFVSEVSEHEPLFRRKGHEGIYEGRK